MARVVLLWHLHQPEYRDPVSGQPVSPPLEQGAAISALAARPFWIALSVSGVSIWLLETFPVLQKIG